MLGALEMNNCGEIARIDKEMKKVISDFAKKNDMKFRPASKELAKAIRNMNGKKFKKEITF